MSQLLHLFFGEQLTRPLKLKFKTLKEIFTNDPNLILIFLKNDATLNSHFKSIQVFASDSFISQEITLATYQI